MSEDSPRDVFYNLAQFMSGFSHAANMSRMRGNSNNRMLMDDDDFFIPDHLIDQDSTTNNGRQRRIIFMNSGSSLLESLALQNNAITINPRNESFALNNAKQLPRAQNLAYDEEPTKFVDNPYAKDKLVDAKILELRRFV
ncbi:hypothetical protein FDP41_013701 [Naegleria fowleri]|uniref:Uncharacterized protein n=1 Tax=Naegleria fowleri TaxID=5763 RepID=A0A6A5BTG7_NAEFO|nr:uncharacterized protein FDP41_013701 [Naegleria fowleri]KAF0980487.1 hypothetical protein FDP41_013701 [Naegleria fowleri]CAG4715939.1 unnamed protein product [Naegleria fowleri]